MNPSSSEKPILDYSNLKRPRFDGGAMRVGRFLVIGGDTTLPKRCVLCNAPADEPPVIASIRSESSFQVSLTIIYWDFYYYVCPRHRRRQFKMKIATCALAIINLLLVPVVLYLKTHFLWDDAHNSWIPWTTGSIGMASMGLTFLLCLDATRAPHLHHAGKGYVYVSGISKSFLKQLPSLPGHS